MRLSLTYLIVLTSEHCVSFYTRHQGRSNAVALPDLDYVETGDYDEEEYDDTEDVYYNDEYSEKTLETRASCRETWTTEKFTIDSFWYKCRVKIVYNSRNVNHRG